VRSGGAGALTAGVLALALAAAPRPARAQVPEVGFALVVGVNRGVDADSVPLRYADDDAVRFRALFRTVGIKTYALARLDDNTSRLHPGAADDVAPPRMAELRQAVARLRVEVAAARAAGKKTVLYVAYAGHGKAEAGDGYVMLEDARLRGPDLLTEIIDPVGAAATHLLVDACHSYFAVLGRGPGGTRRPLSGFSQLPAIAQRADIGVLLSTSSARESHEWAGFQAGVFSHEVRSGLYGAADADGDGLVSYLEIASFVDRANVSVPNELFRPEVFARPPAGGATLLDLRAALGAHIEVDGPLEGHQYIEDPAGVRWADFHNAGNARLLRPAPGRLYLRRAAGDRERVLSEGGEVVRTSQLPLQDSQVGARGAAHDLFRSLFALPFSDESIAHYAAREQALRERSAPLPPPPRSWSARHGVALGLGVAGVAATAAGGVALLTARSLRDQLGPDSSQLETSMTNARILRRNRWGTALFGVGAAALLGGATWWLLGETPPARVEVAVGEALGVGLSGSF
jgi:hypothetical protein